MAHEVSGAMTGRSNVLDRGAGRVIGSELFEHPVSPADGHRHQVVEVVDGARHLVNHGVHAFRPGELALDLAQPLFSLDPAVDFQLEAIEELVPVSASRSGAFEGRGRLIRSQIRSAKRCCHVRLRPPCPPWRYSDEGMRMHPSTRFVSRTPATQEWHDPTPWPEMAGTDRTSHK
jgi:hypothetical protein